MTLFLLTQLELHLIEHHGIDATTVQQVRDGYPESATDIARQSHVIMHSGTPINHVHEET